MSKDKITQIVITIVLAVVIIAGAGWGVYTKYFRDKSLSVDQVGEAITASREILEEVYEVERREISASTVTENVSTSSLATATPFSFLLLSEYLFKESKLKVNSTMSVAFDDIEFYINIRDVKSKIYIGVKLEYDKDSTDNRYISYEYVCIDYNFRLGKVNSIDSIKTIDYVKNSSCDYVFAFSYNANTDSVQHFYIGSNTKTCEDLVKAIINSEIDETYISSNIETIFAYGTSYSLRAVMNKSYSIIAETGKDGIEFSEDQAEVKTFVLDISNYFSQSAFYTYDDIIKCIDTANSVNTPFLEDAYIYMNASVVD